MINLRRLKAYVLGGNPSPEELRTQLEDLDVPVTDADCRSCPNPCTTGHENYPGRFNVDMESQMFGSVRPYHSQVVISTGVSDWGKEVTWSSGTLAYFLSSFHSKGAHPSGGIPQRAHGLFTPQHSNKLEILNGSHRTISDDPQHETVLVFPDYRVVTEVVASKEGAQSFWNHSLDPERVNTPEKSPLRTWVIPYSCVILICSHKRRDNRCGIAAPKLEQEFTRSLEAKGWTVDTQLDHPVNTFGPAIEEFSGTEEELQERTLKELQSLPAEKKALILRNSHTGGHRYAGNCIIYIPQGAGVWYGRISPHEVEAIVSKTVEDGLILPQLLRGGVNISRPGCRSLHDW